MRREQLVYYAALSFFVAVLFFVAGLLIGVNLQ